jgi:serine/threonine-protein kinase
MTAAWSADRVARLGAVLADALAAAHARQVIHRDVKPENVMLTRESPGLKLVDFGIAKLHDAVAAGSSTFDAVVLGTPAYMAPEQVTPGAPVSDRADVYALGVILYQLLTGRLPVDGENARELMTRKLGAEVASVGELVDAPPALVEMVDACLRAEPAARPAAAELAARLGALADAAGALALDALPPASSTVVVRRRGVTPRIS